MNRHSFNVEALKCTLPHALQNVSKRAAAARHIPLPHPTNLGSECRETRHQHAMLVILVLHPAIAVHQIVGVVAYICQQQQKQHQHHQPQKEEAEFWLATPTQANDRETAVTH
jgi:hypothetical protein